MNSIFQDKAKIGNNAWFVYARERGALTNDARYTFFLNPI